MTYFISGLIILFSLTDLKPGNANSIFSPGEFEENFSGIYLSDNRYSCSEMPINNNIQLTETGKVFLYYFYFVPRCDECIILDKALDELIEENFSNEIKNGRLVFKRINLTDPDDNEQEIIRQLRVRRQLLLLVSEDVTVNLTRDAFRFVERDRERFNQSMLGSINGMLK